MEQGVPLLLGDFIKELRLQTKKQPYCSLLASGSGSRHFPTG